VAIVLAVTAAGCGGQSDKDKVRSTIQTYIDGLASGNGKKVCDQLAKRVQAQVKQGGSAKDCAAAFSAFVKSTQGRGVSPAFKSAKIKEVEEKGNTATATVTVRVNGEESAARIPLEKEDGDWKITAPAAG
jgi:hypothetical protein